MSATSGNKDSSPLRTGDSQSSVQKPVIALANPLDRVSEDTREVIRKLVYYQDIYELPSADDIERVSVSVH